MVPASLAAVLARTVLVTVCAWGTPVGRAQLKARASRSILTRARRQSARRELHTAQQRFHRRPATRRLHPSRGKELCWCPHHARQCTMQDQHACPYNCGSHFAVWPEPKAPYRRYLKPQRIAGLRCCCGLATDHYIAQKASPTRINPVISPSCAAGVRRMSTVHVLRVLLRCSS